MRYFTPFLFGFLGLSVGAFGQLPGVPSQNTPITMTGVITPGGSAGAGKHLASVASILDPVYGVK